MRPPFHPLDRAVWSALTGAQAEVAVCHGAALRMAPAFGLFAAVPDFSARSTRDLAALIEGFGEVIIMQPDTPPPISGVSVVSSAAAVQMTAAALTSGPVPAFDCLELGEADGPEMLALATLTRPGPFFISTHRLGAFVGVREGGRLIAMAGERLRPDGCTEVSGVCTAPEHRGKGYAAALMRIVAGRILDRGETPFLHSYADNAGAIALYRSLGFEIRRPVTVTVLNLAAEANLPG